MAGQRDTAEEAAEPARDPGVRVSPAGNELGGSTAAIVARGSPADIAALIAQRPWQRDPILRALHAQRGNAFVGKVLSSPAARPAAAAEVPTPAVADGADDATSSGGPGPSSSRFAGDSVLGDVERGAAELKVGDKGLAVQKIQQALKELGWGPPPVTGTFDTDTETVVRNFQTSLGMKRQDGAVGSETLKRIEGGFGSMRQYAHIAQREAPGIKNAPKGADALHPETALMRDTHTLSADEKAAAAQAITPAKLGGQQQAAFNQKIAEGDYEVRLTVELQEHIDDEYQEAKAKEKHHDKGSTFSMDKMVDIGNLAKGSVDAVFGSWATGAEMKAGTTLKDRYVADRADQKDMKPKARHGAAASRARYFMNTVRAFEELDREHSADRERATEKAIIDRVIDKLATKNEDKLLLITATWSASTDAKGDIKIQRMSAGDDDGDRDLLWAKFKTLIHEYCHSLAHPVWNTFRGHKRDSDGQGAHTLTEGVTELLTRTVLSNVNPYDKALWKKVEGPLYQEDRDEPPDLSRDGYETEFQRAQALVGVVGIYNLYAAYFLGQTQLVGA